MTGVLTDLFVYPIKGLSGQRLERVTLTPERGFPFDRMVALAPRDSSCVLDPDQPLTVAAFHELYAQIRYARLAGICTDFDPITGRLHVSVQGNPVLDCLLSTGEGREAASLLLANVLDLDVADRPVLVSAGASQNFGWPGLADKGRTWACHLVNLASVRELQERIGQPIDPRRFRANVYVDLGEPWIERSWIGSHFGIGDVAFEAVLATVRCATTEVNVETAIRDMPIPRLLMQHYGHTEMGIYATIRAGGELAPGMPVTVEGL